MDAFGRKMSNWNVLSVETALQQLNTFDEDSKDFITRSNTVNYQESPIIIIILNKLITLIFITLFLSLVFMIFVIIVLVKEIANNIEITSLEKWITLFYVILLECTY